MSKKLRYKGGFHSIGNIPYDIEIWQEGFTGTVSTVAFCNVPLEIEWPDTDKLEPVQSSRATLQLYSDTDRQFVDLYTIQTGAIRLDVFREGLLYWSGTLDPELYEEPFSYKENYGVSLTFADVAILDRFYWAESGFMTLREIITETLSKTGIQYTLIQEYVSTRPSQNGSENLLDGISINLDNFVDEDGEPLSMREVLDETLRPFSLRLIQKEGKIILYDLNGIYTSFDPGKVKWTSDDVVLGVDKVYNNIKLTFSPYENTTLLKGTVDPDSIPGDGMTILVDNQTNGSGMMISPVGFKIALSDTGKGIEKSPKAKYFKIDPVYSGNESAGIAWTVKVKNSYGGSVQHGQSPTSAIGDLLLKVEQRAYLGYVGLDRNNYKLKLTLQLMFDPRYNPFENATNLNDEKAYDNMKNWANYTYVPFILTLRGEDGTALCHWENDGVKNSNGYAHTPLNCRWAEGEGTWGNAWMCWYEGNRANQTGLGGWQGNKQSIGYYRGDLPLLFEKMDRAEYIDLPNVSGWLDLQIGTGIPAYDYASDSKGQIKQELYNQCRWILYRDPTLEIVDKNGKSMDTSDFEHKAWINRAAKEELKIDTILGTLKKTSPVAKGQLFKTSDLSVVKQFYRNGVYDQLERLLIGTAYSNYATRHNTLSGTAALLPSFSTYTDTNEPGKYLLLSETQHLIDDESEISMVQFDADNYEGVEFDETI